MSTVSRLTPTNVDDRAGTETRTVLARAPICHCGRVLDQCAGCSAPRCLVCDPYRSDDCAFDL